MGGYTSSCLESFGAAAPGGIAYGERLEETFRQPSEHTVREEHDRISSTRAKGKPKDDCVDRSRGLGFPPEIARESLHVEALGRGHVRATERR
jgi:hypothetical protein